MPRMSHEMAAWTRLVAVLGAGLLYLIGTAHRFVWDIQEACQLGHGQTYDASTSSGDALFPLTRRCNAEYDLVPAFINPGIIILTALAVVAAIIAWRTPRPTAETSEASSDGTG